MRILVIVALMLGWVQTGFAYKANLVDSSGHFYGTRDIRDLSLCGQSMSLAWVAEGPVGDSPKLFLDCSTRPEPFLYRQKGWPGSEVRTLIQQGPSANRIDLTIVGDGYLTSEKEKFFSDAQKITDDLFKTDTFKTYLALFNVHVVFVPSNTSGIGDGSAKDTALGLYRHPSVRQAVMCANQGAASQAAQLAADADYVILVANDKFYGGLGGAFAITTAAPLNITTVLRHELGHNFGRVGEEYDGGQVYSGANFSSSINVTWKHWLTSNTGIEKKSKLLHYSAPWKNLAKGSWSTTFQVPSSNVDYVFLDFSSVGFDTAKDVALLVDGKEVQYTGSFNYDRNFYRVPVSLAAGNHRIQFQEMIADQNNIVSKVAIYAVPPGYEMDTDQHLAFSTYNESGFQVGYRPTEHHCLMRDMSKYHFCSVCTENMWRNFLREVSLVDAIKLENGLVVAEVLPLGSDRLHIEWVAPDGTVVPELTGKLSWAPQGKAKGQWTLRARFVSPEVRDPAQDSWAVHTSTIDLN